MLASTFGNPVSQIVLKVFLLYAFTLMQKLRQCYYLLFTKFVFLKNMKAAFSSHGTL